MKYSVNHPKFGLVEVQSRRGSRQITYKVYADKVRITAPLMAMSSIFPLSTEKEQWILKAQARIRKKSITRFLTEDGLHASAFNIDIQKSDYIKTTFAAQKTSCGLTIFYQPHIDLATDKSQKIMWNIITQFLKKEAKKVLPMRLKELAEQHYFRYSMGNINSAKSRWGSCSSSGKINLSCYLLLLPDNLIDFVLVHELCHTREMNHGTHFKQLMRDIFPNYDELNKKLKNSYIKPQ